MNYSVSLAAGVWQAKLRGGHVFLFYKIPGSSELRLPHKNLNFSLPEERRKEKETSAKANKSAMGPGVRKIDSTYWR